MEGSDHGDDIQMLEAGEFSPQVSSDTTEENLASVQKFVAVCVTVLMICSLVYIGTIDLSSGRSSTRIPGNIY